MAHRHRRLSPSEKAEAFPKARKIALPRPADRPPVLGVVDDLARGRPLPDSSPDLYFSGFSCWNSNVGAQTLGIASVYLHAVCQNHNLWSVENFQGITIQRSKYASSRLPTRPKNWKIYQ